MNQDSEHDSIDESDKPFFDAMWEAQLSGDKDRIEAATDAMLAHVHSRPHKPLSEEERHKRLQEALEAEREALKDIPPANPDALISGIELPTNDEHALTRLQEFFSRTFGFTDPGGMQVVPSDPFLRDVLIVAKQLDKAILGLSIAASDQFLECDHARTEKTAEHMTAREQAQYAMEDIAEFEDIKARLHQDDEE